MQTKGRHQDFCAYVQLCEKKLSHTTVLQLILELAWNSQSDTICTKSVKITCSASFYVNVVDSTVDLQYNCMYRPVRGLNLSTLRNSKTSLMANVFQQNTQIQKRYQAKLSALHIARSGQGPFLQKRS